MNINKCPHCSTVVRFEWLHTEALEVNTQLKTGKNLNYCDCPNCKKLVVTLTLGLVAEGQYEDEYYVNDIVDTKLIYPKNSKITNNEFIPETYYEEYEEACNVIGVSPKSAAAMCRRLLQNILNNEFNIKERTLDKEIDAFIQLPGIPSHISGAIDAVRVIGNYAAHPSKTKTAGEIVPVEKGEAEWLIEVIDTLFDFTFIQPRKLEERRNELNKKLESMGKPLLK